MSTNNKRDRSGGNKQSPASNPKIMISDISGSIIGQFRGNVKKVKYMKPSSFLDFLDQLNLSIDIDTLDLSNNADVYKHRFDSTAALALNKELPLEKQIPYLQFQRAVIEKVKKIKAALQNNKNFREKVQELLTDAKKKKALTEKYIQADAVTKPKGSKK